MVAGAIATVPMSAIMLLAGEMGAMGKQPPEEITEDLLDAAHVPHRSERREKALTVVGHLAYGMGMGALFGILRSKVRLPAPPEVQGMAFGLAVWAVSYEGWVPAAGIMPPPESDRPGRPESMIVAHLVYGAALGALLART